MATKRARGNSWEYVVKRKKFLPRPLYLTFDSEAEGDAYVAKLEALLARGLVPDELKRQQGDIVTVTDAARHYLVAQHVPESDKQCLAVVVGQVGATRIRTIDYAWAESWVRKLKREQHLSPTTIRHYVGALARCFDWGTRHGIAALVVNPLRLLPRGYATYNSADASAMDALKRDAPRDVERDRRLEVAEENCIRKTLAGHLPAKKQRAFAPQWQGALECLFTLAVETGMRMREMYTLTVDQIDLSKRTIYLDRTKNGDKRQIPLTTTAVAAIRNYQQQIKRGVRGMQGFSLEPGRLFPWWSGQDSPATLRGTTARLSQSFGRIFEVAGCPDLRFHDLRHEATSRFFERTKLSDIEISRITGHRDPRVLRRYSNLRGSDLARKLW